MEKANSGKDKYTVKAFGFVQFTETYKLWPVKSPRVDCKRNVIALSWLKLSEISQKPLHMDLQTQST